MATEGVADKTVPPYVPYRTLRTFVDGFQQGIPQRIDRSVMQSMAGTTQRQLVYALQYLKLVDQNGIPQESLIKWVRSQGEERQKILQEILQARYGFLLGESRDGFDLATATSKQFTEKFQQFDIHSDTLRKAESFFLHAASDAGLTISSFIKKPARQSGAARLSMRPRNVQKSNRRNGAEQAPPTRQGEQNQAWPRGEASQQLTPRDALVQSFVMKMPDFNPEWKPEVQQSWFDMLRRLTTITEGDETDRNNEGRKSEA